MATNGRESGFVDDWQNEKALPECNLHMLLTEDFCDVSFRVGSDGHVIRAHRYVLVSRSCVFHAMFCGPMAEQGEITIPDIEADVFKDFLRFLYTDRICLTKANAIGLLYTSRKYDVRMLFRKCTSFLKRKMTEQNLCEILENCHGYGENDIEEIALKLLKKSRKVTLKSPGFKKLCPPCFEKFLTSDGLRVKEEDVFEATLSWAKERCKKEDRDPSPKNQRKVLGSLIYQIRFPLFTLEYLTTTVRESEILTSDERILLVDKMSNRDMDVSHFSSNQRVGTINNYVSRFGQGWMATTGYGSDKTFDCISFTASEDINLVGCQIYGAAKHEESDYKITIRIFNDERAVVVEPYKSENVLLKGKRELSDLMFPKPLAIRAREEYTLGLKMKGDYNCDFGSSGLQTVETEGVTFRFKTSTQPRSHSRTNVGKGQIPGLIWRFC